MTARRVPHLLLAIVVGIAAGTAPIAYAAFAIRPPGAPPTPVIAFGNASSEGDGVEVRVIAANPTRPLWEFGARVFYDGTMAGELTRIDETNTWTLTFFDQDANRRLSVGDGFFVRMRMEGHYELRLLWQGAPSAVTAWDIVPPEVTFAPAVIGDAWVTVDVATVVPPTRLRDFFATLLRSGSSVAWIAPLDTTNDTRFAFADTDQDGLLSAGDRFATTWIDPDNYELRLDWTTGRAGSAEWIVPWPVVSFSVWRADNSTFWLNVTEAPTPRGCGAYSAYLYQGSNVRDRLDTLCGGTSLYGMMVPTDRDGNLRLSVGDRITVITDTYGTWKLSLIWESTIIEEVPWVV